jgi:CheY-like chemotaxis protein
MAAEMTPQTIRVLVADDDADMRTLMATVLRMPTYEVVLCGDAESALVRANDKKPYDVIVSDFMLPGMSGLELIQRLRSNPRTAKVPILMISAHTNYGMEDRAKAAGANHFLNKPFTLSQLRSALSGILASKSESALTAQ